MEIVYCMPKDIPNIAFNAKKTNNSGIDILTIEKLASRTDLLDNHHPEKVHQVAFNMIVYYTEGESKQLVDFVWHPVKKHTIIHI